MEQPKVYMSILVEVMYHLGTKKYELARIYYTALGRERYGMYRVTNKLEDVQEDFIHN